MSALDQRLLELGIDLGSPAPPVASYAPVVVHQGCAYVSGQLPRGDNRGVLTGRVGGTLDIAGGTAAAQLCAISVLAVLRQALDGDLARVTRCLQLTGFVAAVPDFEAHAQVINGASDLMIAVFGEPGRHARAAVGVASLPFGAPVEVSAVFAVV